MKKIRSLILKFWFWLFPKQTVNEINNQLKSSLHEREKNAVKLVYEISDYLKKEFNITNKSEYIPLNVRNKASQEVNKKYRKELKSCRLKITNELRFIRA
ncbi:hypothetical protein [Bizionia sp.]|uniref:hypothetical protein n=1 Tax=Bizionia sp. TaxID=1954480 RepID=UPI003A91D504